jgi:lysophospholipase L1-like esterase
LPFPSYITTRTVTVGGASGLETGRALPILISVQASRALVWAETGYRFELDTAAAQAIPGAEASITLPTTDIQGWMDAESKQLIDVSAEGSYSHQYVATFQAGSKTYTVGPFVLPLGDGSPIDLDTMLQAETVAGGQVTIPDSWSGVVAEAAAAALGAEQTLTQLEAQRGVPGGFADLDEDAKLLESQLPERLSPDGLNTAIGDIVNPAVATKAPVTRGTLFAARRWVLAADSHGAGLGTSAAGYEYAQQAMHYAGTFFARRDYIQGSIAGQNSIEVLARVDGLLATAGAGGLIIEVGANDASEARSVTDFMANMLAMTDKAKAKGLPVIWVGVPPKAALAPSASSGRTYVERYNAAMRLSAGAAGVLFADIHPALVDGATGNLLEVYRSDLSDTFHMNDLAHARIGDILGEQIRAAQTSFPYPAKVQNDPLSLITNGFMVGSGTVPDDWTNESTAGDAVVYSIVDDTSGELPGGRWFECHIGPTTQLTSRLLRHNLKSTGWAAGDVLALTCMMQIEDTSGTLLNDLNRDHTASYSIGVRMGSTTLTPTQNSAHGRKKGNVYTIGPVWLTGAVPASNSDPRIRWLVQLPAGAREAKFRIGAVQVLNLTQLGIAEHR